MNFEEFSARAIKEIENQTKGEWKTGIRKVVKNNGVVLTGIYAEKKGKGAQPLVYLEPLYQRVEQGENIRDVICEMLRMIEQSSGMQELGQFGRIIEKNLENYSVVKDYLVYKLIQTKGNEKLLASVPHVSYLDLSLIFELGWETDSETVMEVRVNNELAKCWGVSAHILEEQAMINTPRLRPARLLAMRTNQIEEVDMREPLSFEKIWMYILTNQQGVNGAAVILYDGALRQLADRFGCDLIVLPSSVHETLLVPYSPLTEYQELNSIVTHVNEAEVPVEERLSDHAYQYIRAEDRLVAM